MESLTPKQEATLLQLFKDGYPLELIGERYGMTAEEVQSFIAHRRVKGLLPRVRESNRKWTDAERAEIIACYRKVSATDVAARYGVRRGAIIGIWKRAGLKGARKGRK